MEPGAAELISAVRRWPIALAALLAAAACSDPAPSSDTLVVTAAPTAPADTAAPTPTVPRVFAVGDSTLLAAEYYDTMAGFTGMDLVYDAKSCRTVGVPSCGPRPIPANTVNAIEDAEGPFDVVVVMAGYDEWWTTFPDSFDDAVDAARASGATHVVWLTYTEGVAYLGPTGEAANETFVRNNETLRGKVASGEFPDVVLADWDAYSSTAGDEWFYEDGIHLNIPGAYGLADYISRKVAFVVGRPCPVPFGAGQPIEDPCPDPDLGPPLLDARALYE